MKHTKLKKKAFLLTITLRALYIYIYITAVDMKGT